jgi:heparosan-N-sulfate-glucuronate 5-epimerase
LSIRPLHGLCDVHVGRVLTALVTVTLLFVLAGCGSKSVPSPTLKLVGPYAHDFSEKLTTEHLWPRDAENIIMVKYPSGNEYNPVTVAQSALAHYDRWLREGLPDDREEFLRDAEWFVSAQKADGLWYYDFPNGAMPVPWVSAMSQGHACSVLVRAYAMTGEERFLEAANRALATFDLPIGKGGVTVVDRGFTYYEEAMPPESPHIFNGMVFAMYGALDMATVLDDDHARRIWDVGVETLAANIGKYDSGSWSYYNQGSRPQLVTRAYHQMHIELLEELYALTGREVFRQYQERWTTYAENPPEGVPK